MSFLDKVRKALAAPAVVNGQVSYLSPYDDVNHLVGLVAPEWLPHNGSVTRQTAMAVPAVKRARTIICTTIARIPLAAYRGDEKLAGPDRPLWLDRTDGPVSPFHRMLWTVDDLLFYGWSLWAVQRDEAGRIRAADRVPFASWRIDGPHVVYIGVDGVETIANPASVVLIPGSDEGLLEASSGAIRHAADLLHSASKAAANPSAYLDLHQTNDTPLTDTQADALIARWAAARRGENGGVAVTSAGIEARELGGYDAHLVIEGRNAAALDVARAMSVPGSAIDATVDKASLNYENAESKSRDLIDFGLAAYMSPIVARLGLDDVVPRGTAIRFELDAVTGPGATQGTPDDGGASTPPAPTATGVTQQ